MVPATRALIGCDEFAFYHRGYRKEKRENRANFMELNEPGNKYEHTVDDFQLDFCRRFDQEH